jgi:hypothetical protein
MKKHFSKILVLILFVGAFSLSASAQIYIKVRPPEPPRHDRPIAPSPHHVWIDGEYVYHRDHYDYVDGYWTLPKPHQVWVPGHWQNRRDGFQAWIPGHWRHV